MFLASLFLTCLLVTQLVTARLPDGRPNGNFRPAPTIPVIQAKGRAKLGPITGRDGSQLPPYSEFLLCGQLVREILILTLVLRHDLLV